MCYNKYIKREKFPKYRKIRIKSNILPSGRQNGENMADARVVRTKKNIRNAFVEILMEKPFDEITVTELCEKAGISRITFYTHYADKYELVEVLFQEMMHESSEDFRVLQQNGNGEGDPLKSYCNLLDSIINLYENHTVFLRQMSQRRNPYLYHSFYSHIFRKVELILVNGKQSLYPRFGTKKFTAFICNGLWAYINACTSENCDINQIRSETKVLLSCLLQSDLFISEKQ
jgi:AcrR family transcriptional regulator